MVWTKVLSNAALATALAGGMLLFGIAPVAHADDDDVAACHRNVDRLQDRLQHDIDRHGPDSKQARRDRHQVDEARESCHQRYGDRWRDNDEHNDHNNDRNNDHNEHYR